MGTSQASDYLENKLVDHIFRSATFAKPAALYVGLFTSAPSDPGGGVEVVGGSYARVSLPPSDSNWFSTQGGTSGVSNGNGGQTSNVVTLTFPAPTENWGTVVAYGIFDAASGGNLLIWDALSATKVINDNDAPPAFPSGALQIAIS